MILQTHKLKGFWVPNLEESQPNTAWTLKKEGNKLPLKQTRELREVYALCQLIVPSLMYKFKHNIYIPSSENAWVAFFHL